MRKIFIVVMLLVALLLCSCKVNKIEYIYEEKPLKKVSTKTLADNALLAFEDKDSIMSAFSFVKSAEPVTINRPLEAICFYNGEVGYTNETIDKRESTEYKKEYYMDGYLYSKWYFHLYNGEYSYLFEKKEFEIDVNLYLEKANENYDYVYNYLKNGSHFESRTITIKGKVYYQLYSYSCVYENFSEIFLYFNKRNELVGCKLYRSTNETFGFGTFNEIDGTFLGRKYEDVYQWMNYPDNFNLDDRGKADE